MNDADRWYKRYLELQETKRSRGEATTDTNVEAALRQVEARLRDMNVAVYGTRRGISRNAKAQILAKQRERLRQAQMERARKVYRDYQNSGAPFALARQALMEQTGLAPDEAQAMLDRIRAERQQVAYEAKSARDLQRDLDAFAKEFSSMARKAVAVPGSFYGSDEDEDELPEEDTRDTDNLASGKGRRPQPAIAKVPVVTFKTTEWASPDYAGTDFGDYPADWVKERKGIHVVDIDGTEVYVAVEAVQREVALGKVPGYAALTPEEADSLHLVLVEAEHYQRSLLRQALVDGDHDPDEVLRTSRAEAARANYRKRLGLPRHDYSMECCGEELAAPVREEARA